MLQNTKVQFGAINFQSINYCQKQVKEGSEPGPLSVGERERGRGSHGTDFLGEPQFYNQIFITEFYNSVFITSVVVLVIKTKIWDCFLSPGGFPGALVRLWGSGRESGRAGQGFWGQEEPPHWRVKAVFPLQWALWASPLPVLWGKAELFRIIQPGEQKWVIYHGEYPDVPSVMSEALVAEGWNELGSSTSPFWDQSLCGCLLCVGTGDMSCSFPILVPFIFSLFWFGLVLFHFWFFFPLSFLRGKHCSQRIYRNKPRGFESLRIWLCRWIYFFAVPELKLTGMEKKRWKCVGFIERRKLFGGLGRVSNIGLRPSHLKNYLRTTSVSHLFSWALVPNFRGGRSQWSWECTGTRAWRKKLGV